MMVIDGMQLVYVGSRGRMTLSGRGGERFTRVDRPDGSILLVPEPPTEKA